MAATKSYNELTVLIPFLNEGEEVITTVKEVRRTAGYNVDIIVVNDHSTDGFHYEEALRPYQVTYIYNKENYGSAPSRDIAVNRCQTPFFLFLDAHMRFYSFNWAQIIVSILKDNDRLILCAQTKALYKDKKGCVREVENRITTFGAYMPLSLNTFLPDIRWSHHELYPSEDVEPIPIVLGAAYAGSKRYWEYLKGMAGLKHYGSEEQYLSLKVWLEGGKCVLLKQLAIGHIYRDTAPYVRYSEQQIFNALWISSLLFPQSLKCRSMAIAQILGGNEYIKAKDLLDSQIVSLQKHKDYYQSIFTQSFDYIYQLNNKYQQKEAEEEINDIYSYLPAISDYLERHIAEKEGLLNGKMGQILWFEYYYKLTGNSYYDKLADNLMSHIRECIEQQELSYNFSSGLSGIGWSIYYLFAKNFLNTIPQDLLYCIDKQLHHICMLRIYDLSLHKGLSGILAYVTLRLRDSILNHFTLNWEDAFHSELKTVSKRIIERSKDKTEVYLALYCQELMEGIVDTDETHIIKSNEFLSYQYSFPKQQEFWGNTLSDANVSSSLYIMVSKIESYE